jgi:GxxExxY protein
MSEEKDPQTYAIISAAMEVHRQLGNGFLEAVYQEALAKELTLRNIPFDREVELVISYKGEPLISKYRADLICFGEVILELKTSGRLTSADEAQVIHYLKTTGYHRAVMAVCSLDCVPGTGILLPGDVFR